MLRACSRPTRHAAPVPRIPSRRFASIPQRASTPWRALPTSRVAQFKCSAMCLEIPKNLPCKPKTSSRYYSSSHAPLRPTPLLAVDASLRLPVAVYAAAAAAALLQAQAEATAVQDEILTPQSKVSQEPELLPLALHSPPAIPEPFQEAPMGVYEYAKLAIGILYLIPIRVILVTPLLTFAWILARLSILGVRDEDLGKPRAAWRRALLIPMPYIVRAAMFIFGFYRIHTRGERAPGSTAPIAVSNHLSFLDPVVLMALFPESNFVSKREIADVPYFGTFVKALQCILVNRESDSSRRTAISEITSRTTTHMNEYPQLVVFPEGTTTNGKSVIEFRHGAFTPGLPVQPMVIRYPNKFCSPASPRAGQNIVLKFLRIASQFVNHLEVTFLPVYKPTAQEASNPTQYAENVRRVIAAAAGATLAPYTYFDAIKYAR